MNAQFEEARALRGLIAGEIGEIQALLTQLEAMSDPSAAISDEEQALKAYLWQEYRGVKHRSHILATFFVARRRRLLLRMQAARVALEQARDFLTADAALLPRLQQAISEAQASKLKLYGPPPELLEESEEQEAQDEDSEGGQREPDEQGDAMEASAVMPTGPAAAVNFQVQKAQDDYAQERAAMLHASGGGDDATSTRAALEAYEERARIMRNAIQQGRGWFEWYYVFRRRYTREAMEYLAREEEIPPHVRKWERGEGDPWGPYLRFCWYEGKELKSGIIKPIQYRMGMGAINLSRRSKRRIDPMPDNPPDL
jgi:hypothetical protein